MQKFVRSCRATSAGQSAPPHIACSVQQDVCRCSPQEFETDERSATADSRVEWAANRRAPVGADVRTTCRRPTGCDATRRRPSPGTSAYAREVRHCSLQTVITPQEPRADFRGAAICRFRGALADYTYLRCARNMTSRQVLSNGRAMTTVPLRRMSHEAETLGTIKPRADCVGYMGEYFGRP